MATTEALRRLTDEFADEYLNLRDGSSARIRPAVSGDAPALLKFFERLSPESRRRRFFSDKLPQPKLVEQLCRNTEPRAAYTLLAVRRHDGSEQVLGAATYQVRDDRSAEPAFAVDDSLQGLGLGTLLLERLALAAVRHGFSRFWAVTHADNQGMLAVFRESGFSCTEAAGQGEVEIDLSLMPTAETAERSETRRRVAAIASLRPFFMPRGVAVVGASRDANAVGARLLQALKAGGYPGPLFPVNPRADEVLGLRAYRSLRELPQPVELAVIATPSAAVLGVVEDAAAAGVRALLIVSAGFAEVGGAGRELQARLREAVRGHGMRMIGPNCLGLLSADPRFPLHATFTGKLPPPGVVAMSSDSGGLGLAVLAAAERQGLGVSSFVSVGNRADVSSNDLLEYWEQDAGTRVILLYLESFGNPRRFARIARRVGKEKPIVALKAGRTQAGSRAAGSHTAALAARDVAVDALLHQTGVLRAESLEELFDLAAALGHQPLPSGRRVAIVTNAGGPAILCADACEAAGLTVPKFSEALQTKLAANLSRNASPANPVDMIASATPVDFGRTVREALSSGEVDALIVLYVAVGDTDPQEILSHSEQGAAAAKAAANHAGWPMLACMMPEVEGPRPKREIPCYTFPEAPARVLGRLAAYADWRRQTPAILPDFPDMDLAAAKRLCQDALKRHGNGWLAADEVRRLLQAARLPVGPGGTAQSADEAAAIARTIGFPVAVKLSSRVLVHKTEIGGVRLNLWDENAVRDAVQAIRARLERDGQSAAFDGVLVQPMVAEGAETLVGMTRDPLFGPLLAFGLGGIHVEILGDVCFRVAPLSERDAEEMLAGIRGHRLLMGYRGRPPADLEALQDLLLRLSFFAEEIVEIAELEFNPVFALAPGQGCRIVDARVRLAAVGSGDL